jgi:Uma2 family endonuclease
MVTENAQQIRSKELTTIGVKLPPLQSGDRLTRYEFERRYQAMPHLKKAELIEGVVYMPSPVSIDHSRPHGQIITWLGVYQASTPGVEFDDNVTVRLDLDNEVQPDGLLRLDAGLGGNCQITADRYLAGPPELIVEVAVSSAAYDLYDKLRVYRRNGVQEYIVWQIYDKQLDWFRLNEEGEYIPLEPDESGVIRSQVFPGLNLKATSLLEGNLADVLAELQEGVDSAEHKAFVEGLKKKS